VFKVEKPLPLQTEDSAEFWEGTKRGELLLQRCSSCGHLRFPPAVVCARCWSLDSTWQKTGGRGRIHTFIVVHRPQHPAFFEDAPYNVAIVELDEGPRLHTRIVGTPSEALAIGLRVEVAFEKVDDDVTMPYFRKSAE
jgi:uncharacterized OB-fold protein